MKWWLISDEDATELIEYLKFIGASHHLHILESGLHRTEEVPGDFQEVKE